MAETQATETVSIIRHTCLGCRDKVALPGYRVCMQCLLASKESTASQFTGCPPEKGPLPGIVRTGKGWRW